MSKIDKFEKLAVIRHSMSHVMASAVLEMFPEAQIAIGPAIENGFYYDFDLPRPLTEDDFPEIEKRMRRIIAENLPITKQVVSRSKAAEVFKDQIYKLELLEAIPEGEDVSFYTVGGFTDLCKGPHVESTKELNPDSFALLSVAGAYWRGNEKNKMLTRLYATAWTNPKDLKDYLNHLKEISERDHRKIGKELDLFSLHEEAGPGLVYWHPMGARIRNEIETFWRKEHYKNGYELLYTPHVGKSWLWETSGHLGFYKDSMYHPIEMDKADYYVKPMNCPFAIMVYSSSKHSYKELPFRWAELGTVYRYEKAGSLHGLMRVRGFTQDDAHLFCTPEQMEDEIKEVLRFSIYMLKNFGFTEFKAYLSTRPEKSVGDVKLWNSAEESLKKAILSEGLEYEVDEGGGAFYGPKIDIKVKDATDREWQLSTIQFDFNMPERFGITYMDADGTEKRPLMIHRALLGSIERFFGVLIEHYKGAFPPWLASEQVKVIPVIDKFNDYAKKVVADLKKNDIRVSADLRDDRMNAKIRDAQTHKIPYTLVVGEKEEHSGTVSVRYFGKKEMKYAVPFDEFLKEIKHKIETHEAL